MDLLILVAAGVLSLIVDSKAGSQDTYVGFVVDDTASMGNEIEVLKRWMGDCVSGTLSACGEAPTGGWIVTTFNDPLVGPVFGPSTDRSRVQSTIRAIRAHGGGDPRELALTGLRNALQVLPDKTSWNQCKIYLFTDALPKDEHLYPTIGTLLFQKKCQYFPILSGCAGARGGEDCVVCNEDPEFEGFCDAVKDTRSSSGRNKRAAPAVAASRRGERIYYELAKKSGGRVFLVDKPSGGRAAVNKLVDTLKEKIVMGFCPTSQIAGPPDIGYANERDCNHQNSCWDKAARKCYCRSSERCPTNPICPETPMHPTYFYPGRKNCAKYYSFSDGFNILTCPKGKVYDRRCSNCNYRHYVAPTCGTYRGDRSSL